MPETSRVRQLVAVAVGIAAASSVGGRSPRAQERFADEPTAGLALPSAPLAGDHDATTTSINPAGLSFLGGNHLELVLTGLDPDEAGGPGAGLGAYLAWPLRLPLLPRMGLGLAVERLNPPREVLAPDPGEPVRLSLSQAVRSGGLSIGAAWHHFLDEGALGGTDTFDLGLELRAGARWALGGVVRDVFAPTVGEVPVQRRWELELVSRPFATDRLEVGIGGAIGERRGDFDPRLRLGYRLTRGLYLRGELGSVTRFELVDPAAFGGDALHEQDVRLSLGVEVSFGRLGAAAFLTGGTGAGEGGARLLGGTGVVRWSGERLPSVIGRGGYVARIELPDRLSERQLTRLVTRLGRLERDEDLVAVVLVMGGLGDGWATLQELRAAIGRLRARGKRVFAYVSAGTTRDFYVAAAADRIYLDPAGGLRLVGLSSTVLYFADLLATIGVRAQFVKIGAWKSAPEAFTRTGPTDEAREMRRWIVDGIYGQLVAGLAGDLGVGEDAVRRLLEGGPYTAEEAGRARLVSAVAEPEEIDRLIPRELGYPYPLGSEPGRERSETWAPPQIAIVYIDGDIVDGKSVDVPLLGRHMVGGETIAASIAWARANPRVRAIVLRIDSPGGSALASDVIAREVRKTRGKKPIVVSMGDIAASGGYFAAAYGDVIYAQPATITGSIGIFSGKIDVSAPLGAAGVTWATEHRGPRADMESYLRPYTDEELALVQEKLRYYYGRFVDAVAKGRGLERAAVDAVGQGRVFTGEQALAHKLVDRMGGLSEALEEAKRRGGLRPGQRAEIVGLPALPSSVVGQLLRLAGGDASVEGEGGAPAASGAAGARAILPPVWRDLLRALPGSVLVNPDAPQARLPFELRIE